MTEPFSSKPTDEEDREALVEEVQESLGIHQQLGQVQVTLDKTATELRTLQHFIAQRALKLYERCIKSGRPAEAEQIRQEFDLDSVGLFLSRHPRPRKG